MTVARETVIAPNQSAPVRPAAPKDRQAIVSVIEASGLFPPDELSEIEDMLDAYFTGESGTDHLWITYDDGTGPAAVAYYAPERMTSGTWNLYMIVVHPARQRQGCASALVRHVERFLTERGERLLLVETAGVPSFERARALYRKCGYAEEARIRDFYDAGVDKVIFSKALRRPGCSV